MAYENYIDVVLFAPQFALTGPIARILQAFDCLLGYRDSIPASTYSYAAKGGLEDMGHQFGPLLKVNNGDQTISIRIAWQQIAGIVSVQEAELKSFGFGLLKRAAEKAS